MQGLQVDFLSDFDEGYVYQNIIKTLVAEHDFDVEADPKKRAERLHELEAAYAHLGCAVAVAFQNEARTDTRELAKQFKKPASKPAKARKSKRA